MIQIMNLPDDLPENWPLGETITNMGSSPDGSILVIYVGGTDVHDSKKLVVSDIKGNLYLGFQDPQDLNGSDLVI